VGADEKLGMEILTRSELDRTGCGIPDCGHDHSDDILYVHPVCHIESPTWTYYEKVSGNLVVQCAKCRKIVARILVAEHVPG
jgi:hypothetical protein